MVLISFATPHSQKIPNLLLAWLGLQVVNIVLNVYTVVLMIIAAASGINPDLVDEMVEIGIDANDVPTLIWITAIGASGIYFTATGKGLSIIRVQNITLEAFSVVTIYFWIVVYSYHNVLEEQTFVMRSNA